MKYKVGDRVKIKSWEQMAEEYGVRKTKEGTEYIANPGYHFLEEMKYYCGKIMEIRKKCDTGYSMQDTGYVWTDEMIVHKMLPNDATYNDLESDMLITYKSGARFFVTILNGKKCLIGENCIVSYVPATATKLNDDQVKKVERVTQIGTMRSILNPKNSYVTWKAPKEMTVEEAEEKLKEILKVPVHIKINS